jgi:SAM-dependent methyltransferase
MRGDKLYNLEDAPPKARGSVHKTILEWFSRMEPGLVLDAPTGFGHLAKKLMAMGFAVVCGEIEPEIVRVPDLKVMYSDLNNRIDAPDSTYDYICCVDGLEHMTNPYKAVEEFARVLKPKGYGIFSIPNYSNIEKRMKFFWNGFLTKPVSDAHFRRDGGNLFNLHNSPLTITLLEFMFRINKLRIIEIKRNAIKPRQYLYLPLVLLMKAVAVFSTDRQRMKYRYDLTLDPKVILGGNNLIFITQKASPE